MKIHGLVDSWGFEVVIVFGLVGWLLEMAWKKTSLKRCLSKSSNSWLLMAVSFPGWFLQCAHGPRLGFPLCSRGGEAAPQLTRGQWCFVKDSPRFTHHQYMENSQMAYFAADLRVLQWCLLPWILWGLDGEPKPGNSVLWGFSSLREELMDVVRYFCLSPKLKHCDAAWVF